MEPQRTLTEPGGSFREAQRIPEALNSTARARRSMRAWGRLSQGTKRTSMQTRPVWASKWFQGLGFRGLGFRGLGFRV